MTTSLSSKLFLNLDKINNYKLFYIGSNWDYNLKDNIYKKNFKLHLLKELDKNNFINIYGSSRNIYQQDIYKNFNNFKGDIKFDLMSVIYKIKEAGICLYISTPQHIDSEVCSMRIFEGIVAGVPIIADKNPFYLKYFKDNIWYFENNNVYSALNQIVNHIKFIKNNEEIVKKIINTRNIFKNYFCTDMQLSYIVNKLENKLN